MTSLNAVPDQTAVRYPQFSPEADTTPTELFEDGDYAMTDSLMRWCRQPENEDYMLDIFCQRDGNGRRDAAIAAWDKQVRSGEWV
ncbi:MAG TPA: hypothetical protein DD685_04305 [Halomonas sp.]|nr:hypothetical protein [Halomonas sp.]|tara:strand:+ start:8182 stop:8436 length:255 start_codon:yes stop_codon:yes gene_type:complete